MNGWSATSQTTPWRKYLFQTLWSDYKVPTCDSSRKLIFTLFSQVKALVDARLAAMGTCVLAIDGWESAAGQATLATNCVLPNGTAFLHKFEALHASQTAESQRDPLGAAVLLSLFNDQQVG